MLYKNQMPNNRSLRILWKVLLYLQFPVYLLLLKFIVSFFFNIDGQSVLVDKFFSYIIWSFAVYVVISGVVSLIILILLFAKKNLLYISTGSFLALIICFTLLFGYTGHMLFFIIPFIVVLYHAVLFSTHSRIYVP